MPQDVVATPRLLEVGVVLFDQISAWADWVERRVETVAFVDGDTVRRQVTVDLIWDSGAPGALDESRRDLHLIPLTLLRKQVLKNFDARDESGRRLPLVSKRANTPIAFAVLLAAAHELCQPLVDKEFDYLDASILDDLWTIVSSGPDSGADVISRLGVAQGGSELERSQREAPGLADRFLQVALDLSRNFLALTELEVAPAQRRVIAYRWDEALRYPATRLPGTGILRRLEARLAPPPNRSSFASPTDRRVTVTALSGAGAPLPGIAFDAIVARTLPGTTAIDRATTDATGRATLMVPPGEYDICERIDGPYCALQARQRLRVESQRAPDPVRLRFTTLSDRSRDEKRRQEVSFGTWLQRTTSISAKRVDLDVTAVSHCDSYHIEFVVPEGLRAERGYIQATGAARLSDTSEATDDRLHLNLHDVPQDEVARAAIWLRPRSSTVLRGATVVAAVLFCVLVLVIVLWPHFDAGKAGPLVAVLAAVPAGLGAYVARTQHDRFTNVALTGLRLIGFLAVFWSVLSSAAVAFYAAVSAPGVSGVASGLDSSGRVLVVAFALGNLATLGTLSLAWLKSHA